MKKSLLYIIIFSLIIIFTFSIKISHHKIYTAPLSTTTLPSETETLTKALGKLKSKSLYDVRIMTYNLLSDSIGFEGTPANTRSDGICKIINEIKPDVIGLQEASRNWRTCIRENTEYTFINPALTNIQDSMTCIIYNSETLTLLKSGGYVFKNGKDSRLRKMVWAVFLQKSNGKYFIVINTHFSLSNQNNSTPMAQASELLELCDNLEEKYNCPLFFVGDFNARERNQKGKLSSPVYEKLCTFLEDTKNISESVSNGKKQSAYASSNDHIFLKGTAQINQYVILSQDYIALLSDHYPIFIDTVV